MKFGDVENQTKNTIFFFPVWKNICQKKKTLGQSKGINWLDCILKLHNLVWGISRPNLVFLSYSQLPKFYVWMIWIDLLLYRYGRTWDRGTLQDNLQFVSDLV
jgi:hypothetical protein